MTAGEQQEDAETGERTLSAEEAERLASAIRPSWEMPEDLASAGSASPIAAAVAPLPAATPTVRPPEPRAAPPRPSTAPAAASVVEVRAARAPTAPPAGSQSAPDTIIEGVATITVDGSSTVIASREARGMRTSDAPGAPQRTARSRRPIESAESANGALPAHTASDPGPGDKNPARPSQTPQAEVASDDSSEGPTRLATPPPAAQASAMSLSAAPVPAGKTRLGVGELDPTPADVQASATHADALPRIEAPQSKPQPRAVIERSRRPSQPVSTPAQFAARTDENDAIELPVTGTSKATLRVVIAIVGAAFLFFTARALFSLSGDDASVAPRSTSAPTTPEPPQTRVDTATPTAAQIPAAPAETAVSAPAPAEPLPAATITPAETVTPAATIASATPSAKIPVRAPSIPAAPPVVPSIPEKRAAAPSTPIGEKKPAPPPPVPGGTGSTGGKKGGGIIRDAPF